MENYLSTSVNGASGYCDRLISKNGQVIFASFFGTETNITAITGSLLANKTKNGTNILEIGKQSYERMPEIHYCRQVKDLKTNITHALVYSKEHFLLHEKCCCVSGTTEKDVIKEYFKILNKKTDMPLHPLWADYLLEISEYYLLDNFNCPPALEVFLPDNKAIRALIMNNIPYLSSKIPA